MDPEDYGSAMRRIIGIVMVLVCVACDRGPSAPVGGLTVITFQNNHLVYAITWYALASMLAGGIAYVIRDEWQIRRTRSYQQG